MNPDSLFGQRIGGVLNGWIDTIRGINAKYEKPRIRMSRGVKIALLFLRLYLVMLVILLAYKFWALVV